MKGEVKYFRKEKGYGFLVSPEHRGDVFVHYSGIAGKGYRELSEGQAVEFDVVPNAQKPGQVMAANVRAVEAAEAAEGARP